MRSARLSRFAACRCASAGPETTRRPPGRRGRGQPRLLNNCGIRLRRGRGGPRARLKSWLGHPGGRPASPPAPGARGPGALAAPEASVPLGGWGEEWGPRGPTPGVFAASSAPSQAFRGPRSRLSPSLRSRSPLVSRGLPRSGSPALCPLPPLPLLRRQIRARPRVPAGGGAGGPQGRSLDVESKMGTAGGSSRPRPPKREPKKSYRRQEAYTEIDSLKEGETSQQTPPSHARRNKSFGPGLYVRTFVYSGEVCTPGPWPSGWRDRLASVGGTAAAPSSLRPPTRTPADRGTQAGAGGGSARASVFRVRGCVRAGVCVSGVHRLTLRSPEPALRTRTGPLQLPRAMILWKQKLKVGRNNRGPIDCNLGQARTCLASRRRGRGRGGGGGGGGGGAGKTSPPPAGPLPRVLVGPEILIRPTTLCPFLPGLDYSLSLNYKSPLGEGGWIISHHREVIISFPPPPSWRDS